MPSAGTEFNPVKSPWTQEQVDQLNRWQAYNFVHPFTCGQRDDHVSEGILIATVDGWVCEECDYTQDWCHEMMLDSSFLNGHISAMKKLGFH